VANVLRAIRKVKKSSYTDGPALLRSVGEIQAAFEATLTPEDRAMLAELQKGEVMSPPVVYSADEKAEALDDFALTTAVESLTQIAQQAHLIAEQKRQHAYRMILDMYYALEDASKDPDNPQHELILEHMENLRRAHESQYGKPIPMRH
jgi:hypothetical protein